MRMWRRMLRSQQNHEFTASPADVARTDGQDGVAGTSLLEQELDSFLHRAKIVDVFMAGFANGARKRFTRHPWDGRFAGRIDIDQNKDVSLIERAAEFVPKVLSACVAMRLKEHEQAIELAAAGRFERSANFGRVMTVVIDHGDVIDYTFDVKAAAYAGKFDEAFADQVSRNIQVERDCRRGRRVADIVNARRMAQPKQAEVFAFVGQPELTAQTFQLHIADDQVGLARGAISDDGTLHTGNDRLHVGFIDTKDCRPVKWHAIHKLDKGALNIVERGLLVEVFAVDRSDDRDDRGEHQETAVAFVCLHDKVFAFAEAGGRAGLVDSAADDERGIEMRGSQHRSDNRSRGGLAMRAGHGDSVFQAHQLG